MPALAYLYIPTPPVETLAEVLGVIISAGISISHFGRSDPPKKFIGNVQTMSQLILEQPEINKYAFMRDKAQGVDLTLELFYDPRWSHSTLSLSGSAQQSILSIATKLTELLNPYLCIQGESGAGKNQVWHVIYERNDCPQELSNVVKKA